MSWVPNKPQVNEVEPAETQRRLTGGSAVVVDVRETEELRGGRIAGSRHIPLGTLRSHTDELLAESEVIFVCRSGHRSAMATAALTLAGHRNARNMVGGMIAWEEQHLPVEL
jgi:rhodanese-related sulfurtransferase